MKVAPELDRAREYPWSAKQSGVCNVRDMAQIAFNQITDVYANDATPDELTLTLRTLLEMTEALHAECEAAFESDRAKKSRPVDGHESAAPPA